MAVPRKIEFSGCSGIHGNAQVISLVGEFYSGRRPQEKVWGRFGDLFSFVLLLSTVFYNVPSPVVILTMFEPLIISVSHS